MRSVDAALARANVTITEQKDEIERLQDWLAKAQYELSEQLRKAEIPVPMILTCPMCAFRHIDEGDFATRVHRTHTCQKCGLNWQPSLRNTVGVHFLPGCKNEGTGTPTS